MNDGKHQSNFQLAESLYENGELDAARDVLISIAAGSQKPAYAYRLLGFIAGRQLDFSGAMHYLDKAVQLEPESVEGWYYLGKSFYEIRKFDEAVRCFDTALRLHPQFFEALHDKGLALLPLYRFDEAIDAFKQACLLNQDSVELWTNLGTAFGNQKKFDHVIVCCDRVLQLKPDDASALRSKGVALFQKQKYREAIAVYERVLEIDPNFAYARVYLVHAKLMSGNWVDLDRHIRILHKEIEEGKACMEPFMLTSISNSPQQQLRLARKFAADAYPASETKLWQGERYQHERIRLAYLSADYHTHATAMLMLDLFKKHDHSRFEVIAVSFGPDEDSQLRKELVASFDRFIDVRGRNDHDAAALLREMEIDIAIDLKGYTDDARPGILAYRPAPLQVNYLGYPGTMGADYIDYLVADRFIIPENEEQFYSEAIVCLPDSYQANGKNRRAEQVLPTRAEQGLPERGFVFCSFNNTYKNNPAMFDVWMNLLKQVDGSVLWLLSKTDYFEENIRTEAVARGVDPERIVFAKGVPIPQHLARVALADLFLDSLPYTAHTTASDALWMNVPVVTCVGSAFPGRVGQSVLNAIDMPELVTHTLDAYQQLALKLATDRDAMTAVREKLRQKIQTAPLFDAERFARHLEWAYEEMLQRHQRGEAPHSMQVPRL